VGGGGLTWVRWFESLSLHFRFRRRGGLGGRVFEREKKSDGLPAAQLLRDGAGWRVQQWDWDAGLSEPKN
jgi:hypothetical protein